MRRSANRWLDPKPSSAPALLGGQKNTFWAKLLLPEVATTKGLTENSNLENVWTHIEEAASSSEAGQKIFAKSLKSLQYKKIKDLIQSACQSLLELDLITLQAISEKRADFAKKAKNLGFPPVRGSPLSRLSSCTDAKRSKCL